MAVGLLAVEEDLLELALGDEAALLVGRGEQRVAGRGDVVEVEDVLDGEVEEGGAAGEEDAERLDAAGGDGLEDGLGGDVALNQAVVVAEGDVAGDVEAGGGEALLGAVHQAGVLGEARVASEACWVARSGW